jgi:hypothetical protein
LKLGIFSERNIRDGAKVAMIPNHQTRKVLDGCKTTLLSVFAQRLNAQMRYIFSNSAQILFEFTLSKLIAPAPGQTETINLLYQRIPCGQVFPFFRSKHIGCVNVKFAQRFVYPSPASGRAQRGCPVMTIERAVNSP